jgi:glycosyltransferase involved in cell wall biosynthesis
MQPDTPRVIEESDLTITVVICTRNRPTLLRKCLEGIAHLERAPDAVVVVDNTSGDKETEALAKEFAAVYKSEPTQGLSRARNRGLAESNSEIVAYLDDDAVPDQHWLNFLLEPFADPNVAVATGATNSPEARAGDHGQEPIRFLSDEDGRWFEIAAFGGLGIGANMAVRKAACTGWKVFDERLGRGAPFQGAEEHHAFVHFISLGYRAAHVPAAIVFHSCQKAENIKLEARNQIAYSMLLFSEYPSHRLDLLRFFSRRALRKPLTWPRDSPDPGEIISCGWGVLLAQAFNAALLFFRTRKLKDK